MSPFSRRGLLRRAVAAAALPLLAPVAGAEGEGEFRLRYVLASCMYGTMKLGDVLAQARPAGCEAVDLWPRPHADHREQMEAMGEEPFAALLGRHGVKLGIITRYDLGPLKLQDEMKVLKRLGGRMLVCGGVGPAGLTGGELKAAVAQFAQKLRPHAEAAEAAGVVLAIENHSKNLICSPDSLRWLIEQTPAGQVGIALAPYHLEQDAEAIGKLVVELGPRLAHVYAWEYGMGCMQKLPIEQELMQMPGRGKLDFVPILAGLRKIRYAGWTSVFMHSTPRGRAVHETAAQTTAEINRARTYLESCLRKGTAP